MVFLSRGTGQVIHPATLADLDRVFAVGAFEGFAELGQTPKQDQIRVRTRELYGESDEYRLWWWNPVWPAVRATRELLSADEAREAFVGYLLGRDWHSGFDWVPWDPVTVRIPYDPDYGRFPLCGRLNDGTLFIAFVTGEWPAPGERRWTAVLHQFGADGHHLGSESGVGGPDAIGIRVAQERADVELARLVGPLLPQIEQLGDVKIRPFEATLNGVLHGLVHRPADEAAVFYPRGEWFYFPWDSDDYDT